MRRAPALALAVLALGSSAVGCDKLGLGAGKADGGGAGSWGGGGAAPGALSFLSSAFEGEITSERLGPRRAGAHALEHLQGPESSAVAEARARR